MDSPGTKSRRDGGGPVSSSVCLWVLRRLSVVIWEFHQETGARGTESEGKRQSNFHWEI